MKTGHVIALAAAVLAGMYFLGKKTDDTGGVGGGGSVAQNFPDAVIKLSEAGKKFGNHYYDGKQSTMSDAYNAAVAGFGSAQVNTTESIRAGTNVINEAFSAGIQLPSLSSTIAIVSANSNIARLADGSTKLITVTESPRDSNGMTAFDRAVAAAVKKN